MGARPNHAVFAKPGVAPHGPQEELIELEFSEYKRDARFPAGWWIVPGVVTGAALLLIILA